MDPDGVWRCYGHSRDPVAVKDRERCAAIGAAVAAGNRGVAKDDRRSVLAGVVDLEDARARALRTKRAAKRSEMGEAVEPVPIGTRAEVQRYLGDAMGRHRVGLSDPADLSAATNAAKAALAILGFEEIDAADDGRVRRFRFVTTEGRAVAVRGRGDDPGSN